MFVNRKAIHAGATCCALTLASLFAGGAAADTQLYQVEIIVFTQSGGESGTPEHWPVRPDPVGFQDYAELREDGEPSASAFRTVEGGDLELNTVARRLDDAGDYRVLEHIAWVQPGYGRDRAPAVALPPGEEPPVTPDNGEDPLDVDGIAAGPLGTDLELTPRPPEGLSGGLRVWRERFLHVETDFRWLEPGADEEPEPRAAFATAALEDQEPVVVMQERRRMRSEELHYLDHPRMGLLIHVKPVDD